MRPCQEGNKVAVALAKKLVQKWKICVGLTVCGVRERIMVPRCRKCWQFGHTVGDCKGGAAAKKVRTVHQKPMEVTKKATVNSSTAEGIATPSH
jgi:hypothetical protein